MRTIYRCYDGDASMIETFDSLEEARAFMQRRGLRYFDWAWCDDDQVREYYIPDDEDDEDYEDNDGAYMPSITPVLVDGEDEGEDEFAECIVDPESGHALSLVREYVDDYGDSAGLYVYVRGDDDREYYEVTRDEGEYVVDYVGDVDPGIERVVDGITDLLWINSSSSVEERTRLLDEYANGDDDAVVSYASSCGIDGGIDDGFVESVMAGVEEWLVYRDDAFFKDERGRWVWRDDEGGEE